MATPEITDAPAVERGVVHVQVHSRSKFRNASVVCFILSILFSGTPANAARAPKYILFLTADGFRTDYIEWYHPTNLEKLIAEGVRVTHARPIFPTVTTPNMTSLVTGSYPRTTGVACNSEYLKEEDRIIQSPRDNQAETIAETLHKAGWKTGAVNHFMLEHRGVDFYETAGYDNAEKTTDAILGQLDKQARFIGAIYGAADHAGHQAGPRSEQVKEAVLSIDKAVGRLLSELKLKGIYEQTLITFNADHGMSSFEDKAVSAVPAEALKRAGFRVATSQKQLTSDTQVVVLAAGVHLVYFRKVTDEERAKATKVLSEIEGAEVLGRKELDALGCHNNRSGDLIVSPLPGYTITGSGKTGGLHGRFAEENPILLLCGRGFIHGKVEKAQTIDIAPTLLYLVKVPPAKTVDGHVIKQAIAKRRLAESESE